MFIRKSQTEYVNGICERIHRDPIGESNVVRKGYTKLFIDRYYIPSFK